jgi:hypothetical protein
MKMKQGFACILLNGHLLGGLLILLGAVLAIILFTFSLINPTIQIHTAWTIIENIFFTGAGLLGIGIAGNQIKKMIKNRGKK